MPADGTGNLWILHHQVGLQLIQSCFSDEQLVVSEIVGLDDIHLLLYLLGNLHYLVFVTPSGDGVLMHALDT